jgi:hypothetical protein
MVNVNNHLSFGERTDSALRNWTLCPRRTTRHRERLTRTEPAGRRSPSALRVTASRAQPRHPGPAVIGGLDPDQAIPGLDRDPDRFPAGAAGDLRDLLVPGSPPDPEPACPDGGWQGARLW